MARLGRIYPFLRFETIGYSVMGKSIPAIAIGHGSCRIHYNASIHANEWITTPLLMQFLEELSMAYAIGTAWRGWNIRRLLSESTLWVVPMLNPDGVELVLEGVTPEHPHGETLLAWNGGSNDFRNWKANIRGVDLNDQFPAHWEEEAARREVHGPGERDYGGEAPLTEPEAVAIAAFTECYSFDMVMALHTQGQEIYWNYRDYEPPESEMMAEQLASLSGYKAVNLTDSDAGYKDWFIQQYRRPGFTIEIGSGVNPLPFETYPALYEEIAPILLQGLAFGSRGYLQTSSQN